MPTVKTTPPLVAVRASIPPPVSTGLSAEGIMAYCAIQLRTLDDDIQSRMSVQQQHREASKALGDLKAQLSQDHLDGNAVDAKKQIMKDMKAAYDALPPNDPGRKQLEDLFKQFGRTACLNDKADPAETLATLAPDQIEKLANVVDTGGNSVVEGEMKKYGGTVDAMLNDISKGAELEMINLQSSISQRQMAVQMATSMLNKYNEGLQSVVGNIGK